MASDPQPAQELRKLDYFTGTWVLTGEMKPGRMGPGGKMVEKDRNSWMDGGFFLIAHSEFKTPMGDGSGVAYLGYDPIEKVYTYDEFNSIGEAIHSRGKVEGDNWIWAGERKTDDGITSTRVIQRITSPNSYDFRFETAKNAEGWRAVMEGKAVKQF
jgi:Protein of unknown function (DUF1579)